MPSKERHHEFLDLLWNLAQLGEVQAATRVAGEQRGDTRYQALQKLLESAMRPYDALEEAARGLRLGGLLVGGGDSVTKLRDVLVDAKLVDQEIADLVLEAIDIRNACRSGNSEKAVGTLREFFSDQGHDVDSLSFETILSLLVPYQDLLRAALQPRQPHWGDQPPKVWISDENINLFRFVSESARSAKPRAKRRSQRNGTGDTDEADRQALAANYRRAVHVVYGLLHRKGGLPIEEPLKRWLVRWRKRDRAPIFVRSYRRGHCKAPGCKKMVRRAGAKFCDISCRTKAMRENKAMREKYAKYAARARKARMKNLKDRATQPASSDKAPSAARLAALTAARARRAEKRTLLMTPLAVARRYLAEGRSVASWEPEIRAEYNRYQREQYAKRKGKGQQVTAQ